MTDALMADFGQIMCVVYGLNYLDKTTLSYASIMGLKQDIGLVGDNYQWLGSMFYFGYIAWECVTNGYDPSARIGTEADSELGIQRTDCCNACH